MLPTFERFRLTAATLILVLLLPHTLPAAEPADAEQPNVVLIMTDDQGWGDLHRHGNEQLDTPVLDGLAARSVRFERFFVSPVCAPTRAALLAGRYPPRTGVSGVTQRLEVMRAEEVTLAEVLRDAGYATGCFGKWHNGEQYPNHPLGQGFDEFFGFCGGHWNDYFDTPLEHNGRTVATSGYITDVITDAALEFIEAQRAGPLLCYVPYNAPHSPWQVPNSYYDKYAGRGFDPATASAYGMVENLDANIGRILAALDRLDLAERTIVVFLTDNGPNGKRYNGGMRGRKGSVHEGGVRVPCFVSWPGKLPPHDVSPIAAHIDLLPTLAELCGVNLPDGPDLDGVSLAPLLTGDADDRPDRMIFTYRPVRGFIRGAVRTQQYRFVRERGGDQLFDMQSDPGQETDVSRSLPLKFAELKVAFESFALSARAATAELAPIPVGYAEAPRVELPAVEAQLVGGVKFRNTNGYAHDWITNWTSTDDQIVWDLEVAAAGTYEAVLSYACPEDELGAVLELSTPTNTITAKLTRAFDRGETARPERSLARGPRWLREFTTMSLGRIALPAGRVELTLRARSIPGQAACELGGLRLIQIR